MFRPDFQITNLILQNIAEIEASKQIIENAPLVPAWERKFREETVVRQVHHSIAVEGNDLNYTEAKDVLEGKEVETIRRRDIKEILNYREAVEFITKNKEVDLNKSFVLGVNKILLKDILEPKELGKFRGKGMIIMNAETQNIVMEPPPADEVEGEVEELIEWFNTSTEVNSILKSGILQHEMTRIHPFIEGNGRTARLLSTWSLYRYDYNIKQFFSLEEYYDQDPKGYYEALGSADDGELSTWLEYFTRGLAVELGRVKAKILDISRDVKVRRTVGQVALNDRQIKIIKFIEDNGQLQNQDFEELFADVSDDTILRDLKDLIDKNLVKKRGKTKAARYELI